jgi:hypothetical protein
VFSGFHLKKSLTINWVKTKVIFKNIFYVEHAGKKRVMLSKAIDSTYSFSCLFFGAFPSFFGLPEI